MPRSRRNVLSLLGATALAGCAAPAVVTRSETDPFEGGIGGTGIVGVVTGFGSILINGVNVEVNARTEFKDVLGPTALSSLRPGHSVTIAGSRGENGFVARRVSRDQLLVGTLVHGTGGLSVNGIPVLRESGSLGGGRIGQRVDVSGVWSPEGVVASRIDRAASGPDIISGTAAATGGALSIGTTGIETGGLKARLNGAFAVAIGAMGDGGFQADLVREGRFDAFTSLRQLSAEGFLEPSASAPGFRIAGLGHNFARDTRLSEIGTRRALYFGRYNGLFGANRGYVVPTNFAARRNLLGPGIGEDFSGQIVSL